MMHPANQDRSQNIYLRNYVQYNDKTVLALVDTAWAEQMYAGMA